MNERILELAKQADAYAWQQIDEGADWDQQSQYFAEKFAELIVRECAEAGSYGHGCIDSELIKRGILEHFGVEE
jgi:hypothetical protein